MHHILAYTLTSGAAATFSDMTAATDPTFTTRNNHVIFTDDMRLLEAFILGATLIDARLRAPHIDAYSLHHFYPPQASATVPSNPQLDDYRGNPLRLPQSEEIAIEMSNNAAETDQAFLVVAPPGWNANLSRGEQRLTVRFTAAATRVANAWSADAAITFESRLRSGVYAINGIELAEAATLAFRLNLPRSSFYNGRKLFPGTIANNATTNAPARQGRNRYGEWGRFHTFEQPLLSVFSTAAGAGAEVGFMDLTYLGDDMSLLAGRATG